MKKVTITLTEKELELLHELVRDSCDTENDEWDVPMKIIEDKLHRKLYTL